jgi:oligosaccharide repeat unit polymerase
LGAAVQDGSVCEDTPMKAGGDRRAAVVALTAVLTAAVVWPLLMLASTSSIVSAITVVSLLALVPVLLPLTGRRFDLFEPTVFFALAFAVIFVGAPIYAVLSNSIGDGVLGYDIAASYPQALYVAAAGCAAFYVGYFVLGGQRAANALRVPSDKWDPSRTRRGLQFIVFLSVVVFAYYVHTQGGVGFLKVVLTQGRSATLDSAVVGASGYLDSGQQLCAPAGVLLLALQPKWLGWKAAPGWLLLLFASILSIGGGDRSVLIPTLLAVVLVHYMRAGRRPGLGRVLIAVVLAFIFVISLPRVHRSESADGGVTSWSSAFNQSILHPQTMLGDFFGGADTAMAGSLATEIQLVPKQLHYQYGRTYLEALTRPVPHEIYSRKPIAADTLLNQTLYPATAQLHVGFAFSIFGEPWLDGGWWSVVTVMLIFGFAMRCQYEWLQRSPRNITAVVIYSLTVPFIFIYMRGGFGVDYQREAIVVVPFYLLYRYTHPRVHPRRARALSWAP